MKDSCSELISKELWDIGYPYQIPNISLYDAQMWLMTQGIYIAPRIYLYHDINLDNKVSWECVIYAEYRAILTVGKSLSYEDTLLLGIQEGVKMLKEFKE